MHIRVLIHLVKPSSTGKQVKITLEKAGTFADSVTLGKVLDFRTRLRRAKREMKLKHAELLGGMDVKKPPRVIRETEKVERALNALVRNPKGLGRKRLDFEGITKTVLAAVVDQPFESNRTITDVEPETINATQKIENALFTEQETQRITNILKGHAVGGGEFRDAVTKIEMDLPPSD